METAEGTDQIKDDPFERCPMCDSTDVSVRDELDTFEYGLDPDAVMLQATIPLFTCRKCTGSWTNWRGEMARDAAIVAHLASLGK